MSDAEELQRATEVFVRGFTYTKSFTHPYVSERVDSVWVMRDGPRTKGDYRNEEWIGCGEPAAEIDRIAREQTRGRFSICTILGMNQDDGPLRSEFKGLGYRLLGTEPLMVHPLREIPEFGSPASIERVTTKEVADRLAKAARSRQVLPKHLDDSSELRQYVAILDGELAGWVRSIRVNDATWCSNMYVEPAHRRKGIARALLCRMLRDDRASGADTAVLLASHAGAKLYPLVGYRQIGLLYLYAPPKVR
jgi:GNAT superfamily N-acetyltransferase